ncbi:hypothetical protein EGW53_11980 [Enterococcus faecium]|uniref:Uncharacterized protein n=1 Tax=Enterococcus faecium TaxID=1352 RepID=A0AB37VWN2_ENTFC|nr:hypothetical protein [Enterococcus faecium]PCE04699.1 hypothetical protein CKY08_08225 [Enterococcus faecium]QDA38781.1 hypothetical protein FHK66_09770 [Enterococcus faecium]ROX33319.1 hypothetical protein EGW27_07975 [Enterococcus faecium]ROX37810.1 hypothetical protein EGW42_08155 [Enterococcus faecium]
MRTEFDIYLVQQGIPCWSFCAFMIYLVSFLYLNGTNISNYLSFNAENFCYLSKKVGASIILCK